MQMTTLHSKHNYSLKGYGSNYFLINEEKITTNIILFSHSFQRWSGEFEDLFSIIKKCSDLEDALLLIGTGKNQLMPDPELIKKFKNELDISVEIMATGAACRTYTVLLAENRNVIAALTLI